MKYRRVIAPKKDFCYGCIFYNNSKLNCSTYHSVFHTSCFTKDGHTYIFINATPKLNKSIKIL